MTDVARRGPQTCASVVCWLSLVLMSLGVFFFQAEDGIRAGRVTGVQTCALPIFAARRRIAPPRVVGGGPEADRRRAAAGGHRRAPGARRCRRPHSRDRKSVV